MPEWHQLVCISGHVKESETAKILQLYATSRSTSVSTRLSCICVRKRYLFGFKAMNQYHASITLDVLDILSSSFFCKIEVLFSNIEYFVFHKEGSYDRFPSYHIIQHCDNGFTKLVKQHSLTLLLPRYKMQLACIAAICPQH